MSEWLIRYNNTPSTALRNRYGKRAMQTPLEKRAEYLEILKEKGELQKVRFLKNHKRAA